MYSMDVREANTPAGSDEIGVFVRSLHPCIHTQQPTNEIGASGSIQACRSNTTRNKPIKYMSACVMSIW